ncbi:MAG: EAL domain-containing protein [Campylobacterales bacterium]|nr:EAL domain-containing protein [Campylobacterales bacterium]
MQLLRHLREAIVSEGLSVHYQPQFEMSTQRLIGFEALCRWQVASIGYISPAEFIPIAEENGLITALGAWVLEHAIAQMAQWRLQFGFDGVMAVNVSGTQLNMKGFGVHVEALLLRYEIPAHALEIEVTESSLMSRSSIALEELERMRALGVRLAIDDFGTGYSSLAHLHKMPVQTLKIDQSFVRSLPGDADACAIVESIVALAGAMKMSALAEGIETDAQLEFLKRCGCTKAQGYWFAKPLEPSACVAFLVR